MLRKHPEQIGHFKPGMKKIPSDDLEAMREGIVELYGAAKGLELIYEESFWAHIDNTGKTPYTDERYWVKRIFCDTSSGTTDSQISFAAETLEPYNWQVTATNLAEIKNGTHLLESAADTEIPVLVRVLVDAQDSPVRHYVFFHHEGYYTTADAEVIHNSTTSADSDCWTRDLHDGTYKGRKTRYSNSHNEWVDGDTIRHYEYNWPEYFDTFGHSRELEGEEQDWWEVDVLDGDEFSSC